MIRYFLGRGCNLRLRQPPAVVVKSMTSRHAIRWRLFVVTFSQWGVACRDRLLRLYERFIALLAEPCRVRWYVPYIIFVNCINRTLRSAVELFEEIEVTNRIERLDEVINQFERWNSQPAKFHGCFVCGDGSAEHRGCTNYAHAMLQDAYE